ncbi:MAG: DUF438 domain-containing protein [Erysipelothrix sp.]|jgi:DUF438 domain-containing protein|nr:DUF438 domain-containing protein [Erysipelothrix sp.]
MTSNHIDKIRQYIQTLATSKTSVEQYNEVKADIEKLTPHECFLLMDERLEMNESHETILGYLERLMMVFYPRLKTFEITPIEDSFLDHMHQENIAFIQHLDHIKEILKKQDFSTHLETLVSLFETCLVFDAHYLKKENIAFPFLEKKEDVFKGVSLMWTLHDQTRKTLKELINSLKGDITFEEISKLIGRYFFHAYGLVQKETYILFPVLSKCSLNELESMREQSFTYGFAFIQTPIYRKSDPIQTSSTSKWIYTTKTGQLSYDQLTLFLDMLPLDCTIVNEKDQVVYFNNPKERFFPRSESIIGRNVVNCHPSHSVNTVLQILDAFKQNKQDVATFWINFKGKKLHIQYLAMRDAQGVYQGVIELTQDVTSIMNLEGEKRLLDWSL